MEHETSIGKVNGYGPDRNDHLKKNGKHGEYALTIYGLHPIHNTNVNDGWVYGMIMHIRPSHGGIHLRNTLLEKVSKVWQIMKK